MKIFEFSAFTLVLDPNYIAISRFSCPIKIKESVWAKSAIINS